MGMKFEGCGASSTSMEPRAEGGAGMKITSGKLIVEKICLVHNSGLWKGSHLLKIEGRAGVAELRDAVLRRERSAEGDEQAEVFEKSVIEISDGELICNNVSMKWMKSKQELVRIGIAGTARIEASTFLEIERSEGDGSVFCGVVEDGKELELNGVSFEYCRCLRGSGGALWLEMKMGSRVGIGNTTNSDEKTMFESCSAGGSETRENGGRGYGGGVYLYVCEGMRDFVVKNAGFLNCEARAGKNMFVLAPKLNDCVTVDSFMFDVVNWSNDRNGFVGSDCVFTETNLLRFVILFKGRTVHVAEDGFDVMRCGSVEDPCMSLWQGLMHVEDCEEERMIEIMKKAMIDDRLDVSGIKIEAHEGTLIERDAKATIVVEVKQRMEGVGLVNSKKAGFEGIRFEVEIVEECLNTTIIANNKGVLSLTRCALSIKENEFVGEIVFVHLIKGELKGKGIEMESESVCNGMFVVESGCRCIAEELKVEGCKVKSGALICVRVGMEAGERKGNIDDQEAGIGIANSSIGWVDGEGSDAVVVKSEGEVSVGAEVNGTKVEGCKCGRSTKGGGVCWQMSAGGWLRVSECSVVQCGCSGISGRGGGVYVGAEVDGVLDFVFEGDKFEGNTAYIGRHIFVACHNISSQINETQFVMDLRGISGQAHMISGSDTTDHREDTDLMPFITIYQSSTIFVSSGGAKGGENNRQCGKEDKCCETLGYGLTHIVHEYGTRVVVDEASEVETEIKLENLTLLAKGSRATVGMSRLERKEKGCVVECKGNVSVERISFEIPEVFPTEHEQIFCVEEGTLSMSECWVKPAEGCNVCRMSTLMHGERSSVTITGLIVSQFACVSLVECVECEVKLSEVAVEQGESRNGLFFLRNGEMNVKELDVVDVRIENGPAVNMLREGGNENNGMLPDEKRRKQLRGDEKRMDVMLSKFSNISRTSEGACGVECEGGEGEIVLQNCSFAGCESRSTRGIEASFDKCTSLSLDSCMFVGAIEGNEQTKEKEGFEREEICRWNGSVVDVEESVVSMKDVSVSNSSLGGLTVKGGSVQIYAGYFWNNGPRFAGYSSLRRNVMCSGDGEMNVMSLKGGDGAKDNSSMWIQSDECKMWGIVDERPSVFFIPILEGVEAEEKDGKIVFLFKGALLIPCNLSFEVISNAAGVDSIVKCEFLEEGFVDENETIGLVGVHEIGWGMEEAEISVGITFGDLLKSHSTSHVIVKNKTELQQNADVNIVKGGEKEKTLWPIIVIVLVVTLLIVLIVSIILAVRWRKAKNEAEDLRVIVNDTVKKDLKLIEMVTMEMELFMHFPAGAMILTMSDAIDDEDVTEEEIFKTSDEVRLISESQETFSGNSSKKGKEKRKQLDQKKKEKTRETEKVQMKIIT
ncbi:uncharacterized protein MONOS_12668 [Monocercomonoides exilis]|uniref:uncharacterized protein n=1 Tax=Monocercomonoides exilis TaxID=2049356 RepID=UPI003559B646|nr:hypothetical protein MONOS_12668 [Monocercomonoides exilis]|eukprot:MONOS_12668.1-p1 / transcript=MONOS_12668.1 / gene=MONOS_12668 / organism=Monocercomonoides_exilis_PA203 / gene_product=unspecified product / transcript_product=unspecified product / location=Mono_scaffold00717:2485-7430(+) / protein_length=1376 / sequence_SO=supercontig / SO=protein_coding / is_pseudo=false